MSRSSRHKRNQQYAVSLFPFMAVLICTLGVLIVMLVMAVQQADVEGRQQRDEVAQQQNEQLQSAQERQVLADFQSESILSVRENLTTRLKDAKADRSYLEQQIKATDQQAEDLFKSIAQLSTLIKANEANDGGNANASDPSNADSQTTVDDELAALEKEILVAEENLRQLREDKSFQTEIEHAIIPFTGSGGTHRQPIFVECVSDGLILQPYDIKLRPEEFAVPLSIGNMLDSALLTVREYWEKHELAGTDAKPYPLLVIRPQGAQSYGLARRAMKSWDDEFGYELVDSSIKLRYGDPDLQLKAEIEAAIAAAKARQQRLARRRRLNQEDQWKTALEVARGLKPSASGGFETVGTGRPAHEVLNQASFAKSNSRTDFRSDRSEGTEGSGNRSDNRTSNNGPNDTGPPAASDPSVSGFADRSSNQQPTRQSETLSNQLSNQLTNQQSGQQSDRSSRQSLGQSSNQTSGQSSAQSSNQTSAQSSANPSQQNRSPLSSSLASTRGSNWALPAQTTGAKAYIRPIRLVCQPDHISIVSQNRVTATIPLPRDTVAAVDPLVSEIWKTIESWGVAGKQAYWKPELRFSVMPGAESRFQELKYLLDDSGLLLESADER